MGTWLTRLQEQQVEQRSYEYSSLVQIQGWCSHRAGPDGISREHALFESLLVFENYPVQDALAGRKSPLDGTKEMVSVEAAQMIEQTNYPLTIIVVPGAEMSLRANYNRERFEQATIQRLLRHLQTALLQLATGPQRQLASLSLLTETEREQVLAQGTGPTVQWNATQADYPQDVCLHQLFEQQVERTPDAIAVVFPGGGALTYWEINAQANHLARHLSHVGVEPEQFVGVCMDRSLEMVVSGSCGRRLHGAQ